MNPFKNKLDPKSVKTSKDFVAPTYEQFSTGQYMPAGNEYGTGVKTPVGSFKASSYESGPIPMKKKCFKIENL